jgi:hypothetical protein
MTLARHVSPHGRVTAVSMMKDEAPYLIEWVAHHLAVGFTDILVYTNDCTDGTDDMLIRLEEMGLAHHRRNVIPPGVKPQPSAIRHAQGEPLVHASDWVMVFDADEFLCINMGDGRIDSLISAAGDADGIVVTWRIFGSGGVVDWSRAPVTEQYLHAAPPDWNKGWGVKALFRFDPEIWKLGIHRPTMKAKVLKTDFPDSVKWLNGSGQPMEDYFKFRGWRSIRRTLGFDWAQMNHYAVKSIDAYAMRKMRGNVNFKADKYNAEYWALQDRNEVQDTRILRYAESRARIAAALLADPVLGRLHDAALARVEARLAAFRATADYAAFRDGLVAASQVPIGEIAARPPKPRDPARIAALMSEVEKKAAARPKTERRAPGGAAEGDTFMPAPIARSADDAIEWVENHDVLLPADPAVFTARALDEVRRGRFERRRARQRRTLVGGGDRLMEVGAGIGFLAIVAARMHPGLAVLAQEERGDLAALGRTLAAAQGLGEERIAFAETPLAARHGEGGLRGLVAGFAPTVLVLNDARVSPDDLAAMAGPGVRRIVVTARARAAHPFPGALARLGFVSSEGAKAGGDLVLDLSPGA